MNISQEVWAIIPTRSGSTGLSGKNIRVIAGKPLLNYMLGAAKGSNFLNRVILTTDGEQIAQVANQFGGVYVRKHDKSFSIDGRPSFEVFRHTLEKVMQEVGIIPRAVVLLRVTAPLCLSSDIDATIALLLGNKERATSVVSVTKSDIHPQRVYLISEQGLLHAREETSERNHPTPRQGFDDVYIRNGAIYATYPEVVLAGSLWGDRPLAYVMPKERSVNINDEVDFILAEALLNKLVLKP